MATVKYTFDNDFDSEAAALEEKRLAAQKRAQEQMKEEAYASGLQEGERQSQNAIEAQTLTVLEELSSKIEQFLSELTAFEHKAKSDAAQLACSIAGKLAPALMRSQPLAEIEALVLECLEYCQKEPRIIIRVEESLAEAIKPRLDELASMRGYPGTILLLSEPGMQEFDCRIEWPDGGLERNGQDVRHDIEKTVQRFVMTGETAIRGGEAPLKTEQIEVEPTPAEPTVQGQEAQI